MTKPQEYLDSKVRSIERIARNYSNIPDSDDAWLGIFAILTDILHWCVACEEDFDAILKEAETNAEKERRACTRPTHDRSPTTPERCVAKLKPILENWASATGIDREASVSDMLTDLRHYCDKYGLNFDYFVDRSYGHYLEEKEEAREET